MAVKKRSSTGPKRGRRSRVDVKAELTPDLFKRIPAAVRLKLRKQLKDVVVTWLQSDAELGESEVHVYSGDRPAPPPPPPARKHDR